VFGKSPNCGLWGFGIQLKTHFSRYFVGLFSSSFMLPCFFLSKYAYTQSLLLAGERLTILQMFFLHPWVIQASTKAAATERQTQRVSSSLPH